MKIKLIIGLGLLAALVATIVIGKVGIGLVLVVGLVVVILPSIESKKEEANFKTEELNEWIYLATGG